MAKVILTGLTPELAEDFVSYLGEQGESDFCDWQDVHGRGYFTIDSIVREGETQITVHCLTEEQDEE